MYKASCGYNFTGIVFVIYSVVWCCWLAGRKVMGIQSVKTSSSSALKFTTENWHNLE